MLQWFFRLVDAIVEHATLDEAYNELKFDYESLQFVKLMERISLTPPIFYGIMSEHWRRTNYQSHLDRTRAAHSKATRFSTWG